MSQFRRNREAGEQRTSPLELFYDLVFVFAVTQVSHHLLAHLSWTGAGQSLLVLLVIWWAWNYTTWMTNEVDPESPAVKLVLIAVMLATLLLAVAIPQAFGKHALLFAGSYVAIQVGRHAFLTFVASGRGTIERERAGHILVWFAATGVLWIAGGIVGGNARVALWLVALLVDYAAPFALYRVPGLRRLAHETWDVGSAHFAERFQLFVIIALGESIVVTGAATSARELTLATAVAFGLAFIATAALWWLYFDFVATIVQRRLELATDRTRIARDAYTYLHAALVAGIVVSAVGDEIVIAHPSDQLGTAQIVAVAGGPALYLLAHVALRLRMTHSISARRLGGTLACLACGFVGLAVPALVLGALLTAILVAVIASEQLASVRRDARGGVSPLERLETSAAGGDPS